MHQSVMQLYYSCFWTGSVFYLGERYRQAMNINSWSLHKVTWVFNACSSIERRLFSATTCRKDNHATLHMHMRRSCHSTRNGGNVDPFRRRGFWFQGWAERHMHERQAECYSPEGINKLWQSLRGIFWLSCKWAQGIGTNAVSKLRWGSLERAHSSSPYSGQGVFNRTTSWDGIGKYTSALSYRGLQVSDS